MASYFDDPVTEHDQGPFGPVDTSHPGYAEFQRIQRESNALRNAGSVQEWIRAMEARSSLTPGERALLARVRAKPNDYEMRGGFLEKKKNPFLQALVNNPWLGPALLMGGAAVPALLGGGGAAGAAAGASGAGVLPSSALNVPFMSLATAVPGASAAGAATAITPAVLASLPESAKAAAAAHVPTPPGGVQPPSGGIPGSAAAPAANTASSFMDHLRNFFTDPQNIAGLAGVVAGLAGGAGGGDPSATAEARRLQAIAEARMRRVDPLHQAVTQLAWGRLPINARQGITPPQMAPLP